MPKPLPYDIVKFDDGVGARILYEVYHKKRRHSMKKKVVLAVAIVAIMSFLAGCARIYPVGALYTEVQLPCQATSGSQSLKTGTSECVSILGLVATGDASIEAAMKDGGIQVIHHIDWNAKNILGIYGVYTTTVYGE